MRGNNNQKFGDIVKKLMKNPKISHRLEKLNALDIWQDIIGMQLCKYITDFFNKIRTTRACATND